MEFCGADSHQSIVLQSTPILDVRAEIEFNEGHIPHSTCLPILDNEQRASVGTLYKQQGQAAAIALGEQLVSGKAKQLRLQKWVNFFREYPQGLITCFRGGLRSKKAQAWLSELGIHRPRLAGGYKAFRHFLIDELMTLSKYSALTVVSGATGSAKTHLLRALKPYRAVLDLEKLANHRGSAFGNLGPQPQQAVFENHLSYAWIQMAQTQPVKYIIEDESRMIGRCIQPEVLFQNLRKSSIVLIEEPINIRIENIYQDYVQEQCSEAMFDKYFFALQQINRRLGGVRYAEIQSDLETARYQWRQGQGTEVNKIWIEKLLKYYYDPLYLNSLQRRQPRVLYRGSGSEVFEYLQSQADNPAS
ncbi:tRNA 2-selenouridine(34) synthase MnmH [Nitrosomonas sp. Nm166]|uniref:tRNA 2-selenouridine(34) synthase MnmH n=1 Tax=Nitrosomonas sp. Nm166 TaxID=1881054 RepID=UPI0008F1BA48|nr:tRNA 2-selenouridine(34) synthase MnmH [Nitrosomonas sp. Nm166]SFF22406.1 tRNA 2-selenouridine synthase [Nitrosomonas sp. Nm166]